jgi:hypothetical protein
MDIKKKIDKNHKCRSRKLLSGKFHCLIKLISMVRKRPFANCAAWKCMEKYQNFLKLSCRRNSSVCQGLHRRMAEMLMNSHRNNHMTWIICASILDSIRAYESHCTRRYSGMKFLPSHVTLAELYMEYKIQCQGNSVSRHFFKEEFHDNIND